jgi:hypothetical protein
VRNISENYGTVLSITDQSRTEQKIREQYGAERIVLSSDQN